MILTISNIKELLEENLNLEERGLLVTILLLKDSNHKLTLAKLKTQIKFLQYRDMICDLQDKGFLKWSGYDNYKKTKEDKKKNPQVVEIIDYMNKLYGTRFKASSKEIQKHLLNRLEDYSIDDIKKVIANRYLVWKDNSIMAQYLTPYTIFRPSKFEKYYNEANMTKVGESILKTSKLSLEKGDRITLDIVKELDKEQVYSLKVFSITNGKENSVGRKVKLLGSVIKSIFASQEMSKKMNEQITENYYYEGY